jgi:hypothetical protein
MIQHSNPKLLIWYDFDFYLSITNRFTCVSELFYGKDTLPFCSVQDELSKYWNSSYFMKKKKKKKKMQQQLWAKQDITNSSWCWTALTRFVVFNNGVHTWDTFCNTSSIGIRLTVVYRIPSKDVINWIRILFEILIKAAEYFKSSLISVPSCT